MGFHRRIINEKVTKNYLQKQNLELLYSSDSLIFMDEFSSKVFELFKNGETYDSINLNLELTKEDIEKIIKAVENPEPPNESLVNAANNYKNKIK
jgi:hypothetical protein